MKNLVRFLFVLILGVSSIGTAAPITYLVNHDLSGGLVSGFIQTDGELGVLGSSSAFLDWNLTLRPWTFPEPQTFYLLGPLSGGNSHVYYQGGSVTASLSQLTFDFSFNEFPHSRALAFVDDEGRTFCYEAQACPDGHNGIEIGLWGQAGWRLLSFIVLDRIQVIAVAAPVPEPATLALVALGLGGLLIRRRKYTS